MDNILFQSNDFFEVMGFSLSHKVLLIRSTTVVEENGEYVSHENIDLLFGGTHFIQMPTWFKGEILIKKVDKDKIINAQIVLKAGQYFEIINNHNTYYIQAGLFEILKNKLNTAFSSIYAKKYRPPSEFVMKENIEQYPYLLDGLKSYIETFKQSSTWKTWDIDQKNTQFWLLSHPVFVSMKNP
ncbi:hypothetical protein [Emticicia sp. BO119]|uniref:hypothetical protein n=1 Tax=Emticicia sp. BO119 TaxID=2757768 RepID=UPI0015F09B25|nr:hypothetical protein [Emticicia sp. BO119]MBA4851695.1 hypothetical protein [Emticicia sp. BO119]